MCCAHVTCVATAPMVHGVVADAGQLLASWRARRSGSQPQHRPRHGPRCGCGMVASALLPRRGRCWVGPRSTALPCLAAQPLALLKPCHRASRVSFKLWGSHLHGVCFRIHVTCATHVLHSGSAYRKSCCIFLECEFPHFRISELVFLNL